MQIKSERVKLVENKLQVSLPEDYARFLEEYGDFEKDGIEIYGYTEEYIDINKIPCVIGATNLYRELLNLSKNEIVLSYTGFEDYIIILDTKSGKIIETDSNRDDRVIANSFEEWFNKNFLML